MRRVTICRVASLVRLVNEFRPPLRLRHLASTVLHEAQGVRCVPICLRRPTMKGSGFTRKRSLFSRLEAELRGSPPRRRQLSPAPREEARSPAHPRVRGPVRAYARGRKQCLSVSHRAVLVAQHPPVRGSGTDWMKAGKTISERFPAAFAWPQRIHGRAHAPAASAIGFRPIARPLFDRSRGRFARLK